MKKSVELYEPGLESYPLRDVVLGNIVMALLISAGTVVCWLLSPALGVLYLIFSVAMVYGVLRRLICTRCYYFGKRCGTGWGLLAARWFSRDCLEEFNESPGIRLAPVVYGLVTLVPLIAMVVLLLQGATTALLVFLALFLGIGFYSSGPGRRRACSVCKMRLSCKGCAAK
ncbi:MAG: hypothetical protein E4G93_02435 [Dehalococcoidia bacterium]|nr:MAG: hypothetical protein E4G93_02435 [Dehalococcoidia bacterium]